MKILAIVLLLVNVGLIAWQYHNHVQTLARSQVVHEPLPSDAAPIKLVSELASLPPLRQTQTAVTRDRRSAGRRRRRGFVRGRRSIR